MGMRKLKVGLLALGLLAFPMSAPAATPKVQAGGPLANSAGQVICTFNFIFTGGGKTFAGTAAHCAENDLPQLRVGDRVRAGDPDAALGRFGPAQEVGTVVVSDGELDFALIQLDSGVTAVASVRGWGGPTGHALPAAGQPVLFTGYGLGLGEVAASRHRAGVIVSASESEQAADIPASLGDSGGPLLDRDGRAVGMISRLSVSSATAERGPTIHAVLARLASRGFVVSLSTAPGRGIPPSFTS